VKAMKKMLGSAVLVLAMVGAGVPMRAQSVKDVLFMAAGAFQVKDDLFAGTAQFAKGASDVTEINLDPRMLGMLGKNTGKDLANKLEFIVVHSYEYDKPGMYKMEDVEAYRKRLMDGSWNCFIHTRDKDGSTDICQKTGADNETHELVIMTAEPKELAFIHLKGKMTIDDLRKFGGGMGGPGFSYSTGSSSSSTSSSSSSSSSSH
jgi:hypothetical protein